MQPVDEIKQALRAAVSPEKAAVFFPRFFKAGPGEYAEGDKFLGVTVPQQRAIAKRFQGLPLESVTELLTSEWHEERLTALFILVGQYKRASEVNKKVIYELYLSHTKWVNNWDLVDCSSEFIVGPYLENRPEKMQVLQKLAASELLWERRIAILATFDYIKKGRADEALIIAEQLLHDKHDLIQKAVGWMLREIGKRVHDGRCPARITALQSPVRTRGTLGTAPLRASTAPCTASPDNDLRCGGKVLCSFLDQYAATMPRTTLRYAIEHFPPERRAYYLKLKDVK